MLVVLLAVPVAHAQAPKGLWVLQVPAEIVEYDLQTLAVRRSLPVPRRLLEHPEYLRINAKDQMVFLPPQGVQWTSGELAAAGDRGWYWDGHQAREWPLAGPTGWGGSAGQPTVTETARQWFLSVEGASLVWFENRFEKALDAAGLERSVRAGARVWRTDLAGGKPETIASLSSPGWCRCATGTCSETCPEWALWAPDGIVGDLFVATRFTPGQLESAYQASFLYRRSGEQWQGTRLAQPIERPLTASAAGEVLIAAIPDGGCCGWENEGNDRTLLLQKGNVLVLYDEVARYGNRNYDVSFSTADARLAPGNTMVAYTVVSTAQRGSPIRLSSGGHEDAAELARIRTAIAALPAVEVVQLGSPPGSTITISHAALVGWLNERELLVAQDGRVTVYDSRGSKRRETSIRVRSAADAFLR